jgi:hypothetical protein
MNKDKRKKPRWLQKLYANLFGYFWKACLICGEMFGGHEEFGHLQIDKYSGFVTCINCAKEAWERSRKFYEE